MSCRRPIASACACETRNGGTGRPGSTAKISGCRSVMRSGSLRGHRRCRDRCGTPCAINFSIASSRVLLLRIRRIDFVDIADGEDQAFENVLALLRLAEQELRPAGDDFLAVVDEVLDQLLQPHRPRLAIHQRDVDHAHRDLARRVLIKLVDDDIRIGVALQIDHDPHRVLRGRIHR